MILWDNIVLYGGLFLLSGVTSLMAYVHQQQGKRIDRLENKVDNKPSKEDVVELIGDKLEPIKVYIFEIKDDIKEMKDDLKEVLRAKRS